MSASAIVSVPKFVQKASGTIQDRCHYMPIVALDTRVTLLEEAEVESIRWGGQETEIRIESREIGRSARRKLEANVALPRLTCRLTSTTPPVLFAIKPQSDLGSSDLLLLIISGIQERLQGGFGDPT